MMILLARSICHRVMLIVPGSPNASKVVTDFLEEPLEKNNDSEVVGLPSYEDLIGGIYQIPFCAGVERFFIW